MNSVERVKDLCKKKKIAISKLEKDLGFSNGYIGQLKKGVLPDDRLKMIADYLGVSADFLMTGKIITATTNHQINIVKLFSGSTDSKELLDSDLVVNIDFENEYEEQQLRRILSYVSLLNKDGKKKAIGQIELLTKIPEYQSANNIPDAAHERTDVALTSEGQSHDDDIMDDDSEWE